MLIETQFGPLRRALAANSTTSSFSTPAASAAVPSGPGVVAFGEHRGGTGPNILKCVPIGVGSDNDTYSLRLVGYHLVGNNPDTAIWMPFPLCEVACTLCAVIGLANKEVVATERMVDTITVVTGNVAVSLEVLSPTGDVPAHFLVDAKGCPLVDFQFDMTGATSGNCLYGTM